MACKEERIMKERKLYIQLYVYRIHRWVKATRVCIYTDIYMYFVGSEKKSVLATSNLDDERLSMSVYISIYYLYIFDVDSFCLPVINV